MDIIELRIKCDYLCEIIEESYGISREDFLGKRRKRELVQFRRMICAILKRHTDASLANIGKVIGGKDHATVLHALREHDAALVKSTKTGEYIYKNYADKFLNIHLEYLQVEQTEDGLHSKRTLLLKKKQAINEQLEAIDYKLQELGEERRVQMKNRELLQAKQ